VIDTAVLREAPWPEGDWQRLADTSVAAAFTASPQAELATGAGSIEIAVRLTDDATVQALNREYRGKDAATNVLSFPMVQPDLIDGLANTDDGEILLGDLALAYGVCAVEAAEKGVPLEDHVSHLIVHGVLHLLGHDHMNEAEAEAMESIERAAMTAMGLHDPYEDHDPPK